MTEKKYRLNKWATKLLKNDRPLFEWANDSHEIVDLLNEQEETIQEYKEIITGRMSEMSPIINLQTAINLVNKHFYFVGDDCHNYAFTYISKELGDLLIKKYPNDINNGGLRIEPVENFNLSQTDLDKPVSDLESLWYQNLQYDMEISKGYKSFEEWKKQEGFGDVEMTTKDCFHCYYSQSNEDGLYCYRETRTKVKGTDTCEHYKK